MIIVNQDKKAIVNFDNVDSIDIVADLNGMGEVIYYETSSTREELGEYKTEERAKEVLQEIVREYIRCNEQTFYTGFGYVRNNVYKMPKE